MRSWRRARSGRMVIFYATKAYKKARFKRMEMRAARQVYRMDPKPIPGFNEDVTRMTGTW